MTNRLVKTVMIQNQTEDCMDESVSEIRILDLKYGSLAAGFQGLHLRYRIPNFQLQTDIQKPESCRT